MNITKEEIRQVLGALHADPNTADWDDAITLLKSKLAEVDAEPVAWTTMPDAATWSFVSGANDPNGKLVGKWYPLFIHPAKQVPMTEDEIEALADKYLKYQEEPSRVSGVFDFARAIEARLGNV